MPRSVLTGLFPRASRAMELLEATQSIASGVRKPEDTEGALGMSKGAYRGIEELAALSSNEGYKPSGNRFERS